MQGLSPGCRICAEGGWSCLFINGRCNGDCFYCPTGQDELGLPTTNTVSFRHPADYVAYLDRFGFNGASLSGGEPLLSPQRNLGFLHAMRHFGDRMHVWLYTNGTLLTEELARQLRDAGLDELCFDIGAIGYNLKALKLAAGVIPPLTVEIPTIPEELPRLKQLLPQLRDLGVRHLNLHQLRLTPYNYPRLLPRGYRYLHGEKVTVLDSAVRHPGIERATEADGRAGPGLQRYRVDRRPDRVVRQDLSSHAAAARGPARRRTVGRDRRFQTAPARAAGLFLSREISQPQSRTARHENRVVS